MDPSQHSDEEPSATAQVVLLHPTRASAVYWVLNEKEEGCWNIGGVTTKRKGWGNPGGGVDLEKDDVVAGTLRACSSGPVLHACAKRELEGETGFLNVEFIPYNEIQIPFLIRWDGNHCKAVFAAQLRDFTRLSIIPEEKTKEIVTSEWFDLSFSPVDIFSPDDDLPYRSHIQRTIKVLDVLNKRGPRRHAIHPLWRLVFPIGRDDKRFPQNGFLLPVDAWEEEMRRLIHANRHSVDMNHIYQTYQSEIEDKIQEAKWREFGESIARSRAEIARAALESLGR